MKFALCLGPERDCLMVTKFCFDSLWSLSLRGGVVGGNQKWAKVGKRY